jgi:2-iminobutanoate/2-iminopropanoate deaminase
VPRAGTSLRNLMKCNIYGTSAKHFAVVNAIYARYFPEDHPTRIFICVPEWTGPLDIEIDSVALI